MSIDKVKYLYVFIFLILFPIAGIAQQNKIRGVVRDSLTNAPISYVAVYIKGTQIGDATNEKGEFAIKNPSKNDCILVIASLGYKQQEIKLSSSAMKEPFNILLSPNTIVLDDVVINPKKEKYTKKNNPAVELAQELIDKRNENSPYNHRFFQYERYEKLTLALNDFSVKQKDKWLYKKFQFIFDYVDTSEVSGKPILTVSTQELLEKNYYRKNPETKRTVIQAKKRFGMDEVVSQENVRQYMGEVFKEVNLFDNNISVMLQKFVSPLSNIGTSFYKYYLVDTLDVAGDKCVQLGFVPFNPESFGFVGYLYVTADSTHFIKKAKLKVPKNINLNFVKTLSIEQLFDRAPDGTRLLLKDDMVVEFEVIDNSQGLYAQRINAYKKQSFDEPDVSLFETTQQVLEEEDAEYKPEIYWEENRYIGIKKKENSVDRLMQRLRDVPIYYYTEKLITILVSGYIETGKNSKFDFGPMNTTISGNTVEGARFRVGGYTTANLNPHLFTQGYVAYGTRDEKLKYMGEIEYAFNKKKYHPGEFPIHSVKVTHQYDINQLGQHYLYTNKDNVFLSLKRKADTRATYLRRSQVEYMHELACRFSYAVNLNYKTEYATPWVEFIEQGLPVKNYSLAEAGITLRYAPHEKYYQTKGNRYPISKNWPVITLSHKVGIKGILESRYNVNRTELGYRQRIWFSAFGYLDVILRAGKVWDKAPFPLLMIPNANLSYIIQPESFNLMNAMEFINDQYAAWFMTYNGNGILFNRIPGIKYLKLREIVTFKGLVGNLSSKNNPVVHSKDLFEFPEGSYAMGKKPYMEIGAGIDNIFKILRIDYVWRLSYMDHPHIDKRGVRITLHFAF